MDLVDDPFMRVGLGFDIHPFMEGRRFVLGGVEIPYEKGLYGHSDADALVHAVCDAILGAVGAGDMGRHFPDEDPRYRDVSSLFFLSKVREVVEREGWKVLNIDTTIVCERPKLLPYIEGMVKNIASTLGIEAERVNVKATRGEGLGFVGRGEGVAVYAIASVVRKE